MVRCKNLKNMIIFPNILAFIVVVKDCLMEKLVENVVKIMLV